jgi:hypothetical protein
MGETEGPGMFSDLTKQELQILFTELDDPDDRRPYLIYAEIAEVRKDVKQALADVVHAEFAPMRARAEAEGAGRRARAEAGDPEAYLDFF